jgi:hypothetical protein
MSQEVGHLPNMRKAQASIPVLQKINANKIKENPQNGKNNHKKDIFDKRQTKSIRNY